MRYTAKLAAIAIAAVALVTTLSQASASAHGAPFTVTAGSAPAGTTVPVTLTPAGATPQFLWKDTSTGNTFYCTSLTLKGTIRTGSSTSQVGTIDAAKAVFATCTGPAGWRFAITGVGTWGLNVADSTAGSSSVTFSGVRAHLQSLAGPTCSLDFAAPTGAFTSSSTTTAAAGSLASTYTNTSQGLGLPASNPGSLGLWNVKGGTSGTSSYCLYPSVLKQGDRVSWSATWKVVADTPVYNPVAIS